MSEARPGGGAGATPDTRWTTHRELADRLGMTAEGARRRAEREGWPSLLPGNDNRTRVGVPGDAVGRAAAEDGADDRPEAAAALREALARARGRAGGAEAAAAEAPERRERAEAAAAEAPDLHGRAARAEGERDALREDLLAARAAAEDAGRRAGAAEARAAEARRRADQAKRREGAADGRVESFLRERIAAARAEAARQGHEAAERELAARTAGGFLARVSRAFRHRRGEP